jgi:hypothetical protein
MAEFKTMESFASFEDACKIVNEFIEKHCAYYSIEIIIDNQDLKVWGNEFFEFHVNSRFENGYFEIINIEVFQSTDTCFFVPKNFEDFKIVMDLIGNVSLFNNC